MSSRGRRTTLYALPVLAVLAGCVTATYVPTGQVYPARTSDCGVEVFTAGLPDRAFHEIGILEGEGNFWKADLEDLIPKLREEACLAGGDALILLSADRYVRGDRDDLDEVELYAVATVVRWGER